MGEKALGGLCVATFAFILSACNDAEVHGFDIEVIDFAKARTMLDGAPARIELELYPSWAQRVVRQMEIMPDHRATDDERVEGRVIGSGFERLMVAGGCHGALTLDLLGVEVSFDEQTRFEDQDGTRLTCIDFVTKIEAFIALGQEPQITAERRPPLAPQHPSDPVFLADELKIDDEDHDGDQRPELELQLNAEHLESCDALLNPPSDCVGAIRALGALFAIGSGATRIQLSDPEPRLFVRFNGAVKSVDLGAREIRLTTGTVLRLVRGSDIEYGEHDLALTSLDDAEASLDLGRLVEAHGRAAVLATDPLVLWIDEVELEIERDLSEHDFADVVQLDGEVLAVDSEQGHVVLPFDTRLRITEVSSLEGEFDRIADVDGAMYDGRRVRAAGRVVVEEIQRPVLVTRADRVAFALDER